MNLPLSILKILLCVDSKSVLQSVKCLTANCSHAVVHEIWHLIHLLSRKGTDIAFCWVPSHCGIFGNELANRSAKKGARKEKHQNG